MPKVKTAGKTRSYPYTRKGMAAARKAAKKAGTRVQKKRGKKGY